MKFLVFSILMLSFYGNSTQAAQFPIVRPLGLYSYKGNFSMVQIIRTELASMHTQEGEARIEELRKDGYNCINKNLEFKRCRKSWVPETPPEWIAESLKNFMEKVNVKFYPAMKPPELIHDGSGQEWYIREEVLVMGKTVNIYKVTQTPEKQVYLSFPVSEDQPIGNLLYLSYKKLGFQVIATQKESDLANTSYFVMPYIEGGL